MFTFFLNTTFTFTDMWYCSITNYLNENNEHQKFDAVCVGTIIQISSYIPYLLVAILWSYFFYCTEDSYSVSIITARVMPSIFH